MALLTGPLGAAALACPPADAARLSSRPLDRGDRGGDVRELQRVLGRLHVARLRADGVFGRRTAAAVRRYEHRVRIAVDARVSTGQARGMLRRAHLSVPAPAAPSAATAPSAEGTVFPVRGKVTWGDGFGDRGGRHEGVDLLADCGTTLVTPEAVHVRRLGEQSAAGRYAVLTTAEGAEWVFMHLRRRAVHTGDDVAAGSPVGEVGRTGNATTCHLHVERWTAPGWYQGGHAVDPAPLLRGAAR